MSPQAQLKTSSGLLDDFLICEEDAHPSASSLALPEVTKVRGRSMGSGSRRCFSNVRRSN